MSRPPQTPVWPFMFVLLCLFVLSVTAPRGWERIARKTPIDPTLASRNRVAAVASKKQTATDSRPASVGPGAGPTVGPSDEPPPAADPRAQLIAADGPHLAEIVAPVLAEPRAKIANSADATPASDAPAVSEAQGSDSSSSLVIQVAPSAREDSPASMPNLESPSPTDSQLGALPPEESKAEGSDDNSPPGATRLATRPTRSYESPDLSTPDVMRDEPGAETVITDSHDANAAADSARWAQPVELLARLEALGRAGECSQWAVRTGELVRELTASTPPEAKRGKTIVGELRAMTGAADALLLTIQDRSVAVELLRVRHALSRRLDVWELLPAIDAPGASLAHAAEHDPTRLAMCLADVASLVEQGGSEGQGWRSYLMLDALESVAQAGQRGSDDAAREVAQRALRRLSRGGLTSWQREFLTSGPLAQLGDELRNWAAEPVDALELLADLERFEQTERPSDARRLAEHRRHLSWLNRAEAGELAGRIETHYRNSNLRVAISEDLLDRLVPRSHTSTMPVNDRVLGLPTRGSSTISTTLDVRLLPDPRRLRLALEANGQIFSTTRTTSGPATLYSDSDSHYFARKLMEVKVDGVRTWPAEGDSEATTRLRRVRTDFDGIPLLGALVENVARSRHADQQAAARREVRRKVAQRAQQQIDAEADARVQEANQQLHEHVLAPLVRLDLQPSVIEMETTPQRLVMRLRLAAEEQLAGSTPRPQAPGDSLASVQCHQSLLNNIAEQLHLEGRTYTPPELRELLAETFHRSTVTVSDAPGEDVRLTFAASDAVQVKCEEGRIRVTLSFAQLTAESQSWRNFAVRISFRAEIDGLSARLAREGTIQLIGPRLNARGQVIVRGIFNRTFPRDWTFDLVDEKWSRDARLADLRISQFVVQDGWIGVAVGPDTAGSRQSVARKP